MQRQSITQAFLVFVTLVQPPLMASEPSSELGELAPILLGAPAFRHGGLILDFAYSPNGTLIATAGCSSSICLWSAKDGTLVSRFVLKQSYVPSISFSANGSLLACGGSPMTVWDLSAGKEIASFGGGHGVALSPDGKLLAATSNSDRSIEVFDVATRQTVRRLEGHEQSVRQVIFSPDGKLLLSSSGSYQDGPPGPPRQDVRGWDVATGKQLFRIADPFTAPSAIAYTPGGKSFALTAGTSVGFRNSTNGASTPKSLFDNDAIRLPKPETTHNSLTFASDGTLVAASSGLGTWIYNVDRGWVRQKLAIGPRTALSPVGKTLAQADGGTLRFWDVASGGEWDYGEMGHRRDIRGLVFLDNGRKLLSAGDETIVWDTSKAEPLTSSPKALISYENCFLPLTGTKYIYRLSNAGALSIWQISEELECLGELDLKVPNSSAATISPDRQLLAIAMHPNRVHILCLKSNKLIREFRTSGESIESMLFLEDGQQLLVASGGTLAVYDTDTSSHVETLAGTARHPSKMILSPDGRTIAACGGLNNEVVCWEVGALQTRLILNIPKEEQNRALAFSPDGRFLATGGVGETIRLWDLYTGEQRWQSAHFGRINELCFAPRGDKFACARDNGQVELWPNPGQRINQDVARSRLCSRQELEACWRRLAGADAADARLAIGMLIGADTDAIALLTDRLAPEVVVAPAHISRWIADLGSHDFRKRSAASDSLTKIGRKAQQPLEAARKAAQALELRRRLDALLDQIPTESAELLRGLRAIEVAERIGTAAARRLLTTIANRAEASPLSKKANASLQRLKSN